MNVEQLRVKLFRRVLSPVEIVYSITKVTSEPPLYECNATLVLTPHEFTIDDRRYSAPPRDDGSFLAGELSLLRSDSVLEKLVSSFKGEDLLAQDDYKKHFDNVGILQRAYLTLRSGYDSAIDYFEQFGGSLRISAQEQLKNKIKNSFRRRSAVLREPKSNIVKIVVRGLQQGSLDLEVKRWIDAYRERIDEISKETFTNLYKARIEEWEEKEKYARTKLNEFRKENPKVSAEAKKLNDERIFKLNVYKDLLQGIPLDPSRIGDLMAGEGTEVTELRKKKAAAEDELRELLSKLQPENDKVRAKRQEIKAIEEDLKRALTGGVKAGEEKKSEGDASAPPDASKPLDPRVLEIQKQIDETESANREIEVFLPDLNALVEEHRRAADLLIRMRGLQDQSQEQTEVRKLVNVQIQDPPKVALQSVNYSLSVAMGSLIGLGIGIFIAFVIEFFARKIRYKKDVEDELGLKVVGVIPEN
jgi:uncharacterized protein involved in exopolysaccharide biosynthesis